jgi:hypothetical protein
MERAALAEIDLEHRAFFRLGMKERGALGETARAAGDMLLSSRPR